MDPISTKIALGAAGAGGSGDFWIATLGGTGTEYGNDVAVDSLGNVYICGQTNSAGAGGVDFILAKYDALGVIQWQRTLGGSSTDSANGIAVDSLDNVYVCGRTYSLGGFGNAVVAKYNSSGTIQWQRMLTNSNDYDEWLGIAIDSSNNVYLSGQTSGTLSGNTGSTDMLIAKYNSSGTLQWQRAIGQTYTDISYGIAVDASSNVYVCGYQLVSTRDVQLIKYSSSGTLQWQRKLSGTGNDYGYGVGVDSSNNVYVCGYSSSTGSASSDILLAKYNSSGTLQWQRALGGSYFGVAEELTTDSSNNIFIVGRVGAPAGAGNNDCIIVKYNSSGTLQWQRTLGGTNQEWGTGIAVDNANNIYLAGNVASSGAGDYDCLIAKLPDDGSLTGTYGSLIYAAAPLTDLTPSLTSSTTSLSGYTPSLTDSSSTLTDSASSLTSSTTTL